MDVGIIGSGKIGATVAEGLAANGHRVAIANSRGPESLTELVGGLGEGARAATVEEAAAFGDIVIVAVPLKAYDDLPAAAFEGKLVIDANNYYPGRDGEIAELESGATTSSELLAGHLGDARVIKAFNTMNFRTLAGEGRPQAPREQRLAIFLAGDDDAAKAVVAELIDELGFAPVDTGSLAEGGRRQQPGSLLFNVPMTVPEAEAALGAL